VIAEKRKETIKLIVAVTALVLVLLGVAIAMIVYEVEGETNMPYKLSKIVIIGTVEGVETTEKSKEKIGNLDEGKEVYLSIQHRVFNSKIKEFKYGQNISDLNKICNLILSLELINPFSVIVAFFCTNSS